VTPTLKIHGTARGAPASGAVRRKDERVTWTRDVDGRCRVERPLKTLCCVLLMWRRRLPILLLLVVAVSGAVPAGIEAAPQGAPDASPHAAHRHVKHSGLEHRIALLTRALDLDTRQQTALRKVLLEQREQALRIWSDASLASASRIVQTKALSRRTTNRIRALLNPEQRTKYDAPPQDGPPPAISSAHVEDWMKPGSAR
jgi:hypothetical protein